VINGCSDLLVEVFGPQHGRHARTVMGVPSLPFGMSVEIDLVVAVA
jgi:enamine deaminase RidA (YjgF/YER057c/UK114 family)